MKILIVLTSHDQLGATGEKHDPHQHLENPGDRRRKIEIEFFFRLYKVASAQIF